MESYTDSELQEYLQLCESTVKHYNTIFNDTATITKCSSTEKLALELCLRESMSDLNEVIGEIEKRKK